MLKARKTRIPPRASRNGHEIAKKESHDDHEDTTLKGSSTASSPGIAEIEMPSPRELSAIAATALGQFHICCLNSKGKHVMRNCLKATVIQSTSGLDVCYHFNVMGCNRAATESDWRHICTLCGQAHSTKTCYIYRQPELAVWCKRWRSKIGQGETMAPTASDPATQNFRFSLRSNRPKRPRHDAIPRTSYNICTSATRSRPSWSDQSRADSRWESYSCACLALAPLPARAYR